MTNRKSNRAFPLGHLNSWRMHRQWLDRPFTGRSLLDLVRSIGWVYSPGGSTPYLSLWARTVGFRPAKLNRLVFREQKLVQLETIRGCTMLLPVEEAPIALRIRSRTFTELAQQARTLMPIDVAEMGRLKVAVLEAVEGLPRNHGEIRDRVPSKLVRDFPMNLKRIGMTGSLTLAINLLKEEGRIIKLQTGKRLDSTDYSFALLSDAVPGIDTFPLRTEHANIKLAKLYFGAEGPARVKDFAWWAGINATEAIQAAADIRPALRAVRVANSRDEFLIPADKLDEFVDFTPARTPAVNLVPYRDIFLKGQREVVDRFVRREHSDKPFSRWKGKLINDPLATVIHNGEVVGIWEWNPDRQAGLVYSLFANTPTKVKSVIRKRATELGTFIQDNLGEIRGMDYGRHQMTRIKDLKPYWGHGPKANVGTV